jgi:phosphoenolpyruvate carboxylase
MLALDEPARIALLRARAGLDQPAARISAFPAYSARIRRGSLPFWRRRRRGAFRQYGPACDHVNYIVISKAESVSDMLEVACCC